MIQRVGLWLLLITLINPEFVHAASPKPCNERVSFLFQFESAEASPKLVRPNEPLWLAFSDDTPSTYWEWYLDGDQIQTGRTSLCHTFSKAGNYRFEVIDPVTPRKLSITFDVQSYTNISVDSFMPNPTGSDTKAETITLRNNNPFSIFIDNWSLKSRTSQTTIPFEATILANTTVTFPASNKLRNSSGAYDLFNESGHIVDTVIYKKTEEGKVMERSGIIWQDGAVAIPAAKIAPLPISEFVTKQGKVVRPRGKTIDIETDSNEPVHIVIHSSFTGVRPKLHKGDTITVTGIWKKSKNGPYISVRDEGQIALITTAKQTASASKEHNSTLKTGAIPKAAAAAIAPGPTRANINPGTVNSTDGIAPYEAVAYIRWILMSMILIGASLALPNRKKNSV